MNKTIKIIVIILTLTLLCSCSGGSSVKIKLGTGGASGTYFPYGESISALLHQYVPGVEVKTISTGASKTNIEMLAEGSLQMAIAQNDIIDYARKGQLLFSSKLTGFSAICTLFPEACQIVAGTGISSIEELPGKRVSLGGKGSATECGALQILETYGITPENIITVNLGFAESAQALREGEIDAFFCVAGVPTTAVAELADAMSINLLEIDAKHVEALCAKYPFYTAFKIPRGSYTDCNVSVNTLSVRATLIVSDKLDADLVYSITRALFEHGDVLLDKARYLNPRYSTAGVPIPFHPGAERYYNEIGVFDE